MFETIRSWWAVTKEKLLQRILPSLRRGAEITKVSSEALRRMGDKVEAWEPDDWSRHLNNAADAAASLQLVSGAAGADKFAAVIAGIRATDFVIGEVDDRIDEKWPVIDAKLHRLEEWLQTFVDTAKDLELLGFKHNGSKP